MLEIRKENTDFNPVEWGGLILILILAHAIGYFFQDLVHVNGGQGGDGMIYYLMAEQALSGRDFEARSPFVYRQLLPWLAAFFSSSPQELLTSFKIINLTVATATAVLLLILLRFFVDDWRLRLLLVSLYALHYLHSIRDVYFLPISTTHLMMFFIVAALIALEKIRTQSALGMHGRMGWSFVLAVVMFLAVLNRSSFLPLALAAPLCFSFTSEHTGWRDKLFALIKHRQAILFLPLVTGIIAFVGVRFNAEVSGLWGEEFFGGSPFSTLFYNLYRMYRLSLLAWVQSIGTAYGPIVVLLIWQWRLVVEFLSQRWDWCLVITVFLTYGSFATSQRFLCFMIPIYLVLLGIICKQKMPILKNKKGLLFIIILAQTVSQRLFWSSPVDIPSLPKFLPPLDGLGVLPLLFTPFNSDFIWYDIIPENNRNLYGPIVAFQYIIFIAISLLFLTNFFGLKEAWLKNKNRQ